MSDAGLVLVGLAIAVGLVGVVVPVLPGGLLVWAAILVWAISVGGSLAWVVLGVATLAIASTQVLKYVLPARRLEGAGVPRASLVAGVVGGVVGFFVVPVVGAFVGFPAGILVSEWLRLRSAGLAWDSTKAAIRSVGLSIAIELAGSLVAAGAWLVAVLS